MIRPKRKSGITALAESVLEADPERQCIFPCETYTLTEKELARYRQMPCKPYKKPTIYNYNKY